jgi:hypothetical protein
MAFNRKLFVPVAIVLAITAFEKGSVPRQIARELSRGAAIAEWSKTCNGRIYEKSW